MTRKGAGVLVTADAPLSDEPIPDGMQRAVFYPKLYHNGFPKSGLHLSILMAMCLVEGPAHENPWAGTFDRNGWSNVWMADWRIYQHMSRLQENGFLKGHTGWREDIELFLWQMGAAFAFVYRDLRDVAVSMSFHVLAEDDEKFSHPEKHLYRELPSHEDVLLACVEGIGEYPSLIERWERYAPWLDVEWVHPLRYEDMRLRPFDTATAYIDYVYRRVGEANGVDVALSDDVLQQAAQGMTQAMEQRQLSPTYRKGLVGGWREHWTDKVDTAFADTGGYEWLRRLGYSE